jgi:phosphoglycerol transferase MdoB-like AlkP superfamily enzyme
MFANPPRRAARHPYIPTVALIERQVDPDLPALEPDVPEGPAVGPSRRRTFVLGLLATLAAAVASNAVLQAPLWWDAVGLPTSFLAGFVQRLDILVIWLLTLFLVALTGRLWAGLALLTTITLLLAAVNDAKMAILTEPLVPSDRAFLTTPGFLVSMVPPGKLALGAVGIVASLVLPLLLGRRLARRFPPVAKGLTGAVRWRVLAVRIAVLLVTGALLFDTTRFNDDGNLWRRLYEAKGAVWEPYSQAMNYRNNGFVGGLLYNMPIEAMPRPADYSAATMQEIADKYAERATVRNAGRDPHALDDVNVVLVLSESFSDPTRLKGIKVDHDPIPLTRQHIADAWGGEALANFYGTGTSSMEFSALTGQDLALFNPQIVAPYQNFVAGMDSYPSAVGWFADHGHTPIAIHPYTTEMYRRSTVYPMFGFDEFVHDSGMQEQDKLQKSTYISDQSAFDEVEYQLRTHDKPMLVNLVTMQNHVPMADWYDDPVPVNGDVDADQAKEIGGDVRGEEYSDKALDTFLSDIKASGEKTVVVFYGDHYPGIFSDEVLAQNPGIDQLRTPLLIWSSQGQDPTPLPLTSSNEFLPYVFDLLGQPLPPYYELLTEVREQIGALSPGHIVAPDGRELTEDELTPGQQQLLHDYRLVQYDFSIGERHAVDSMWYPFH